MNDRVSRKPPSVYMREDEAMDQFVTPARAACQAKNRGSDVQNTSTIYDAGISSAKPSGMFRFGKAIVNAFNPSNVWQGINGIWKEAEDSKSPEKAVLQERQAKAEKAYAELKQRGFKRTKTPSRQRGSQDLPSVQYEDAAGVPREATFRDSGIDMGGYRSSTEYSKDDHVGAPVEGLMPPPPIPGSGRSPSPMVGMSSARRSSLSLHKPSSKNLRKVTSHFHLSPTKKAQSEISLPLPSIEADGIPNATATTQPLRNQRSKKELVKQQRLTKRVSDLETKLEKARRELGELQEPSKLGLKPFKPGALPSLPSQRVLNSHGSNNDAEEVVYAKGNTSKESLPDPERDMTPQVTFQLQSELKSSVSRGSLSRKRKSGDALCKPGHGNPADDSGSTQKDYSKKASVRSRKSPEVENNVAAEPVNSKIGRNVTPHGPRRISSRKTVDPMPPLPAISKVFDASEIDPSLIISMRSVLNSQLSFGKVSDDIINLRVLYPSMTEVQLVEYIGNLPANKKVTDHKSLSHQDRPASPFLAPPRSPSPVKTRARKTKRGISPPPPSLISPKRPAIMTEEKENEDSTTINSEGHDTVAPLPESLSKRKAKVGKAAERVEKPLPAYQREEYEWPEDVF